MTSQPTNQLTTDFQSMGQLKLDPGLVGGWQLPPEEKKKHDSISS